MMNSQRATTAKAQIVGIHLNNNEFNGSVSTRFVYTVHIPLRYTKFASESSTKGSKDHLEALRIRRSTLRNSRARSLIYTQRVRLSVREHRVRSERNIRSKTNRLTTSATRKVGGWETRSRKDVDLSTADGPAQLSKDCRLLRRHSYPRYTQRIRRVSPFIPKLATSTSAVVPTLSSAQLRPSRRVHYAQRTQPASSGILKTPIPPRAPDYSTPVTKDAKEAREAGKTKGISRLQSLVLSGIIQDQFLRLRRVKFRLPEPVYKPPSRSKPPLSWSLNNKWTGSFHANILDKFTLSKGLWRKTGKGKVRIDKEENEERIVTESPWLLWCSACSTLHGLTDFSDLERAESSKHRRCKGTNSNLNVCQHWSTNWHALRDLLAHCGNTIYCKEGHHGNVPSAFQDSPAEVTITREASGEVVIRKRLVLAHFPNDAEHYPCRLLRKRIEQLKQYLCPHVYMSVEGFEEHLYSEGGRSRTGDDERKCGCCDGVHRCPERLCETEWWLYRREGRINNVTDRGVDEAVLEIERRLGKMSEEFGSDGATGERWMSQVLDRERVCV
jgi:hypothetical protein